MSERAQAVPGLDSAGDPVCYVRGHVDRNTIYRAAERAEIDVCDFEDLSHEDISHEDIFHGWIRITDEPFGECAETWHWVGPDEPGAFAVTMWLMGGGPGHASWTRADA